MKELDHKQKAWLDNFLRRYIAETKDKKPNDPIDGYEIKMAQSIIDKVDYP